MKSSVFIAVLTFQYSINLCRSQDIELKPESKEPGAVKHISRTGRAGLIAFKPFGETVNVGLDLLLPFVKVPTRRKLNSKDNDEALLTVNTAAVTIGGLISGLGLFVGQILKSIYTLRGKETSDEDDSDVETRSHLPEHRLDFGAEEGRFTRMLEPFKLVYRNSSGARVRTSLSNLINTIEDTFLENDIDLSACIQKSLCYLIQRANKNMKKGVANGVEKMIDGLLQLNWVMHLAHETAIEDAILAGKSNSTEQCSIKYSTCKWEAPEEQLFQLFKKRVKFI